MPEWLKDAVFYEIYPSSFYDSNGDGIGDIEGIIQKLDYVRELGCNALWINPCFDSPFLDGGYDIRDYKKVSSRYGTNEDLIHLFRTAHEKGIHVLLDLVPGHTSDQHPWFKRSCESTPNEYWGRYIWTSHAFEGIENHPYISGMTQRSGAYMLNFFASQPALNYGWGYRDKEWMSAPDSKEAFETREALKDIMRFWLDLGCDGYRVDMADSLVKNDDENKSATCAIWRDIRNMLDRDYPQAALVAEWSNPYQAILGAGFHMDFYLDHPHNGYNTLLRDYEHNKEDNSFFRAEGQGDIARFLDDYLPKYKASKDSGYISMFTCNHDTPRPARTLSNRELKLAYAFIFTMPGVPFLYYGDEIGMKYLDVETKEGGYHRTGSRTPMQWDKDLVNMGFSKADPKDIYLPVDPLGPSVSQQKKEFHSLWSTLRQIIFLRHKYSNLQADGDFRVLYGYKQFLVYKRGRLILALNSSNHSMKWYSSKRKLHKVYLIGECDETEDMIYLSAQSFVIFEERENYGSHN